MKKTTYWVIGMYITGFLFSLGLLIYYKYLSEKELTKIEMTTEAIKDYKYIKVLVKNGIGPDVNIESNKNVEQSLLTYPKEIVELRQKGDTLLIVPKKTKGEKGLRVNRNFNVKLVLGKSTKALRLTTNGISYVNMKQLNLSVCHIVGNMYNTKIESCTIDSLSTNTENDIDLLNSSIKSMSARVNNSRINTEKSNIKDLHLIGKSEYNEALKLDSAHSIKHIIIDPTPGDFILTKSMVRSEIIYK
jgi:hypothetical protein